MEVLVEGESKLRSKPDLQNNIAIGWLKSPSEETRLIGRTQGDEIVVFDGPRSLVGSMTTVRATGATPLTIQGERAVAAQENSAISSIQRIFELSRPLRCPMVGVRGVKRSGSQSNQSFIKLAAISAAVLIGVAAAQMQATKNLDTLIAREFVQTLEKTDVSQESVSSPW